MKESRSTEGVNKMDTNNKPNVFVKVILTIIALLLLLLIGQVLPVVEQLSEAETPTPVEQVSEGCIKAREQAKEALSLPLNATSY